MSSTNGEGTYWFVLFFEIAIILFFQPLIWLSLSFNLTFEPRQEISNNLTIWQDLADLV